MTHTRMDVFLDLSHCALDATATAAYISALTGEIRHVADIVTCVLPPHVAGGDAGTVPANWRICEYAQAISAAEQSLHRAALNQSEWLVLRAPLLIGPDHVGQLREAFHIDPYFGYAIPRVSDASGTQVEPLRRPASAQECLSRRAVAELPETYIVADLLPACILIRREVTANIAGPRNDFRTAAGTILEFLVRARRIGFRGVVCNRAIVACHANSDVAPDISPDELHRLDKRYGDGARARQEGASSTVHERERLLAHAFADGNAAVRSLLMDARGVPAGYNGTAEFVLGLLDGIAAAEQDWTITVLVDPGVDLFHDLGGRYPKFRIVSTGPAAAGPHTIAFRPSQPWHFSTMMELHRIALLNVYVMFDTIAWDTIYPSPRTLHASWEFLAQYADGIAHISDFTRQRFRTRFPSSHEHPDYVYYPSLDATDYVKTHIVSSPDESYIFVAGNEYDHKDVEPTAAILHDAFPFQKVRVFGRSERNANVGASIGKIPQDEVERFYACAKVVVFPSFYEGFGFPMIRALSYGRTVVARDSALVRELAALYTGPGRLLVYSNPGELVEQVGCALHGNSGNEIRTGTGIAGRPSLSWVESGRQLLDYLTGLLDRAGSSRWQERDRAIRQLIAYGS